MVAILLFYAEAKLNGHFMESLLNLVCVYVRVCVVIAGFNLLVASFAQKLFLESYLALCAAIKLGYS